ncbi:MAG TPA: 4Fe-4S ferredoxin [Firmicutes bacterium]|jgi:ferredoxin-type protein NapH|nr:4Fe-4S ferredoxin [Bacillota bacterium]
MSNPETAIRDIYGRTLATRKPWQTLCIVLPMVLLSFMILNRGITIQSDPLQLISLVITYLFINLLFVLMVHSGKIDRYRAILFVTYAVCFVISFIPHLMETRGSNTFTSADILQGKIPFCHIVVPMTLIPAVLKRTIIFPGSMLEGFASIASMLVLWMGVTLALGKGFCSWGCFYGGLEDGFSRLARKPLLKKINPKWRNLSFAVLLGVVLTSIATLSPTYCTWLCPFKTVTEFEKVSSVLVLVQTIIFVTLFLGLVVVLPLLTKKRTQCSFLCPFGAMQSLTNKINAFEIRIDKDKCTQCKVCIGICPTFSIDEDDLEQGKANLTCTKCAKCISHCPRQAISMEIKGVDTLCNEREKVFSGRTLIFLYPAFILLMTMGGGMIRDAIHRILLLLTTGKLIQ